MYHLHITHVWVDYRMYRGKMTREINPCWKLPSKEHRVGLVMCIAQKSKTDSALDLWWKKSRPTTLHVEGYGLKNYQTEYQWTRQGKVE